VAKYFSYIYNKDIVTPGDTQQLKKTHNSLNISETAYDEFTMLFAHTCCRGKDDNCRRRILRINSLLKAHICPSAGKRKNLAVFCKVISKINPVRKYTKNDEEQESVTSRFDKLSPFGHLVYGRTELWNEKAQAFHLRKRLRDLEKTLNNIYKKSEAMEKRVTELEGSYYQSA